MLALATLVDPEGGVPVPPGRMRLEHLLALAAAHHVTPSLRRGLMAHALDQSLDEELAAYISAMEALNARRNCFIGAQCLEMTTELNKIGIVPLYLKGAGNLLSHLYAHPAQRFIGDIDALIPVDDLPRATERLVSAGYRACDRGPANAHHPVTLVHAERPAMVELHQFPASFLFEQILPSSELFDCAAPIPSLGSANALAPSPTHGVLHNALHTLYHHRNWQLAHVPLRDALDLVLLARRHRDTLDWQALSARLARLPGGSEPLSFYLSACRWLFPGTPLPEMAQGAAVWLALAHWRARGGRRPSRPVRAMVNLEAFSRDIGWRLRHRSDERRRLAGLALQPARYADLGRRLAGIVRCGLPHPFPGRRVRLGKEPG